MCWVTVNRRNKICERKIFPIFTCGILFLYIPPLLIQASSLSGLMLSVYIVFYNPGALIDVQLNLLLVIVFHIETISIFIVLYLYRNHPLCSIAIILRGTRCAISFGRWGCGVVDVLCGKYGIESRLIGLRACVLNG